MKIYFVDIGFEFRVGTLLVSTVFIFVVDSELKSFCNNLKQTEKKQVKKLNRKLLKKGF